MVNTNQPNAEMGSLMYLVPQGKNVDKAIEELERRLELLENVVKALQLDEKPKRGRPPKDSHEPKRT